MRTINLTNDYQLNTNFVMWKSISFNELIMEYGLGILNDINNQSDKSLTYYSDNAFRSLKNINELSSKGLVGSDDTPSILITVKALGGGPPGTLLRGTPIEVFYSVTSLIDKNILSEINISYLFPGYSTPPSNKVTHSYNKNRSGSNKTVGNTVLYPSGGRPSGNVEIGFGIGRLLMKIPVKYG